MKPSRFPHLSWVTTSNTSKVLPNRGQAQWLTPVIPALWEAEAGRSQGQEIKTILANMVKPHLYQNTEISWAWWCTPVFLTTREAEAGELLEPRRRRLQWAEIAPLHSSLWLATEQDCLKKKKNFFWQQKPSILFSVFGVGLNNIFPPSVLLVLGRRYQRKV